MENTLEQLLTDGVVDEVLGRLKSGKEADIYLVRQKELVLAAKLYKERNQRNFKNNVSYKEGRNVRNSRTQRAMDKGSRFGQRAAEEAWKSAEADALYKLHAAGARVPKPVLFYEGVLLMELVTDASGQPARRLIDQPLSPEQAQEAYNVLRAEMIKFLCADLIHGDLSPYNVLWGEDGPVVIDFPQVVGAAHNRQAEFFFRRDLDNIRHHLGNLHRPLLARGGDAAEIWREYTRRELTPDFVPTGTFVPPQTRPEGQRRDGPGPRRDGRRGPPRQDRPAKRPPQDAPKNPGGPVVQYVARPPSEAPSPKPPGPPGERPKQFPRRPPRFPRGRR
jgi:RIO kinase 1